MNDASILDSQLTSVRVIEAWPCRDWLTIPTHKSL
jgi:hypothetical protein